MKESKALEFKESISSTFLKTVSAFANYCTGEILFGVTDQGEAVGLPDPKQACLDIENRINDTISPVPSYSLSVDSKSGVVRLRVEMGIHKPYLYRAKAYRRNDTATVEVDRLELTRLILEGQNLSFEDMPARFDGSLSFSKLEEKLIEAVGLSRLDDDTLRTLELERVDGSFNIAGELLADANTLPGVDIARLGEAENVFLDRELIAGVSVLDQLDKAVQIFRRYYTYEEIEGVSRVGKELIPETAFREAVANALVHRLWDIETHIRIAMHPDRIEVSSPGGLPTGLSKKEYLEGRISVLRNPIVGNVFFRLRIIERFGTGVLRIKDSYKGSSRKPAFEVGENFLCVTLPRIDGYGGLDNDEVRILDVLAGREMQTGMLAEKTGFGKTKVQKILARLADKGYVTKIGTGRGTRYRA